MNLRMTLAVVGLLALGGCAARPPDHEYAGASTGSRGAIGHQGGDRASMMEHRKVASMCPVQVAGTKTQAEHVPGGAALAFTTTGDVAEVRRRVGQMVEMHNRHHASDAQRAATHEEHARDGGSPHRRGMQGGMNMMPAAQAKVEEIPGGARIVFVPRDAAQLDTLREHVARMTERMGDEGCPMMSEH